MNGGGRGGGGMGWRSPFTAAQWQELEHQALIFKYMVAGVPVPPELLIPIRRSFESVASRFYHYPSLGYCHYGKKVDLEPGRCRRTDGKKWRCSKDAYPDSKYCERHMHRGRNRSRKPVETQAVSQSQSSSSSIVTSIASSRSSSGSFLAGAGSGPLAIGSGGAGSSQFQADLGSHAMASNTDFRYLQGVKTDVDDRSFSSEAFGGARSIGLDSSSMDISWSMMSSQVTPFPLTKTAGGGPPFLGNYSQQLPSLQDIGQPPISSISGQQLHSFFGTEFAPSEPAKHDTQSLRPFFDEWPKTRDSWSDLDDDRSNRASYSTTHLSISIPMASSDFSTTSSRSHDND